MLKSTMIVNYGSVPSDADGGVSDDVTLQGTGTDADPFEIKPAIVAKVDGIPADWFAAVRAFVQTLVPTLTKVTFASDCNDVSGPEWELGTAVGTAAVTNLTTSPGGVINNTTGTTANSARILRNKNTSSANIISNLRTAKYAVAGLCRVVTTAATFAFDLIDATDGATASISYGPIQATSAVNWCAKVGTASAIDLGVPFDTNWHTFMFIADATNVSFYIGAQDGSSMTLLGSGAQVTAPNAVGYFQSFAQNLGTAAACVQRIDAAMVIAEPPSNSQ